MNYLGCEPSFGSESEDEQEMNADARTPSLTHPFWGTDQERLSFGSDSESESEWEPGPTQDPRRTNGLMHSFWGTDQERVSFGSESSDSSQEEAAAKSNPPITWSLYSSKAKDHHGPPTPKKPSIKDHVYSLRRMQKEMYRPSK